VLAAVSRSFSARHVRQPRATAQQEETSRGVVDTNLRPKLGGSDSAADEARSKPVGKPKRKRSELEKLGHESYSDLMQSIQNGSSRSGSRRHGQQADGLMAGLALAPAPVPKGDASVIAAADKDDCTGRGAKRGTGTGRGRDASRLSGHGRIGRPLGRGRGHCPRQPTAHAADEDTMVLDAVAIDANEA
jgi:hypothetical protein